MNNGLQCIETSRYKNNSILSSFIIEPLPASTGISLGNALRRTLLTNVPGFAIIGCKINSLIHEFGQIDGVREEPFEILLNLKDIIFQPLSLESLIAVPLNLKIKAFLKVRGPLIVTAGMLNLPKNLLKILNPEHYICTILTNNNFYLTVEIEYGTGYSLKEEKQELLLKDEITSAFNFPNFEPGTLFLDSCFMPVKQVTFKIKLINDDCGILHESLYIEILTNGSISPKRSIYEALYFLIDIMGNVLNLVIIN